MAHHHTQGSPTTTAEAHVKLLEACHPLHAATRGRRVVGRWVVLVALVGLVVLALALLPPGPRSCGPGPFLAYRPWTAGPRPL